MATRPTTRATRARDSASTTSQLSHEGNEPGPAQAAADAANPPRNDEHPVRDETEAEAEAVERRIRELTALMEADAKLKDRRKALAALER